MMRSFVALLLVGSLAGGVSAEEVTPEKLVDSLNGVFGKFPKMRASHAKGVCVKGNFTPAADAASLSKAPFLAAPVPLLGRFSFGGGNPKASDKQKSARGLALRFDPDGKASTDFVFLSAPVFFARTPEEVVGFLEARFPGPDGKPDPAKVKAFTDAHPWTAKQGAWVAAKPVPASYAGLTYHSIHAYKATAADGKTTAVKFKFEPVAGEMGLTDDEAKAKPEGFFTADLEERLKTAPVEFTLVAIVGTKADPTGDPTVEWPEADRKAVKLGRISISGREDDAKCDATTFDPNNLADGLAGFADDRILPARSGAYAVSLSRRSE
ncbi:MAG: catalase family peroxidase [Deltaproteobacteria bacterium]